MLTATPERPKLKIRDSIIMPKVTTLNDTLKQYAVPGRYYEKQANGRLKCYACGHYCLIPEGGRGICQVRYVENGVLKVPHGYVAGLASDPVEKKPFYHVYPGSKALSFGMLGCDFHCAYCQNWTTSQALRHPEGPMPLYVISAQEIVDLALRHSCRLITSTYNEPLITSEWAMEIFKLANEAGLPGSYVSNGHGTPEILDIIKPYVKFYKVDLKTFNPEHYLHLGGKLETVLKTIELLKEKGFWVEIVTLLVPGFNDSEKELKQIAKFIASVSPHIPWHITAFHPDYEMLEPQPTQASALIHACQIGKAAGLHFCYAGNLPGSSGDWENTICPQCGETLVERMGYTILKNNLLNGHCPHCHIVIPGCWD